MRQGLPLAVILGCVAAIGTFYLTWRALFPPDTMTGTAETFVRWTSRQMLEQYKHDVGDFPTSNQGLDALVRAPEGVEGKWRGPYVKTSRGQFPIDPWGRAYQYQFPGKRNRTGYDFWSNGPSPEDSRDDIGNW
jgi:general secretion pathway protein G